MPNNEMLEEYWDKEFTSSERSLFQKCGRVLLKQTFIVRDKDEESRKMFYFVSKNADFFSQYFSFMGFDVIVQKDSGVIMFSNAVNENISSSVAVNRFRLKKIQSIVLCCLWTLLSDRIHRDSLDKVIKITLSDLNMELEKYDYKKGFDKGELEEILRLFYRFNLIGMVGEIGEENFTIILYPSLQFAINESEFVSFVKVAENKMKGYLDNSLETENIGELSEVKELAGIEEIDLLDEESDIGEES